MIEPVTDIAPLREAFYRVFSSRSPFAPSGRDEFPVRALIYPTYGYYLEAEQFHALTSALRDCGEGEFYISMVESEPEERVWDDREISHWRCHNPTFEEYGRVQLFIENALYSVSGTWGVLVSHEDHALLVCHGELWDEFERHYPDWSEGHPEFIDFWKEVEERGVNVEWLKPFLSHLTKWPETKQRI